MRFKFGKGKKLSDVLRVAQFLEENDIEYEMLSDIDLQVGPAPDVDTNVDTEELREPEPKVISAEKRAKMEEAGVFVPDPPRDPSDALFRTAVHGLADGTIGMCNDRTCKEVIHLGGVPL